MHTTIDQTTEQLWARWARWMRWRNLAPATIRKRRGELIRWLAWIGPRWATARPADLVEYFDRRPLKPSSRAVNISHLAAFYRWAQLEELVAVDPVARLIRPRLEAWLPRPIGDRDLALALTLCDRTRDVLILTLAALAGLRCCELARLRWVDVDLAGRPATLRVLGKGNRERSIPIHPQLALILTDAPRQSAWVLGRRYTPKYVSELGAAILATAGIEHTTLHQLRHWFGTDSYRNDHDLLGVARLMGHRSVRTTQGYADLVDEDGARIVAHMSWIGGATPGQLRLS